MTRHLLHHLHRSQAGQLWAFWALSLIQAILGAGDPTNPYLQVARTLVFVAQCFIGGFSLILGLHLDPVASTTAFWLTRPISRREQLYAKLLYTFGFVVLPLLASLSVGMATAGFTGGQFALSIFQWALYICLFSTIAGAVAAHSRGFPQFVGGCGAVFLLGFIATATLNYLINTGLLGRRPSFDHSRLQSSLLIGCLIVIAAGLISWRLRSLTTNVRRSVAVGVGAILISVGLLAFRPFSFLQSTRQNLPGGTIEVVMEKELRTDEDIPGEQLIWSHFRAKGIPENVIAVPEYFHASFKTDEKFRVDSSHHGQNTRQSGIERIRQSPARGEILRHLRRDYPADTVWSRRHDTGRQDSLPQMNTTRRWPKEPVGRFHGALKLELIGFNRLADVPLAPGFVRLGRGFGIGVRAVQEIENGTRILVEEAIPDLAFTRNADHRGSSYWKGHCLYVLFHSESREAFILNEQSYRRSTPTFLNNQIVTSLRFDVPRSALRERLTGHAVDDWEQGLRLHVYHAETVGMLGKTFDVTDYEFAGNRARRVSQYVARAETGVRHLKTLKWPGPADPVAAQAFVDEFILHSPDTYYGNQFREVVKMLNDIGPEIAPFLLRAAPHPDSFHRMISRSVLRRLLRPEHLPEVIAALARDPGLAWILRSKHWETQGLPALTRHLKRRDRALSGEALIVLSGNPRPEQYADLAWHATRCASAQEYVFRNLRQLPGFPYEQTVRDAWKRARLEMISDFSLSVFAAELGELDALHDTIRQIARNTDKSRAQRSLEILKDRLDTSGDQAAVKEWLLTNATKLRFDPAKKKYVL